MCVTDQHQVSLGDEIGQNIIYVDHAVYGRPYLSKNHLDTMIGCTESMYTDDKVQVCILGNTLSLMKYWCQGKKSCVFDSKSLEHPSTKRTVFYPEATATSYTEAIKICKINGASIFKPEKSKDFIKIATHLMENTNLYGAWIYPSDYERNNKEVTEPTNEKGMPMCKVLVNPRFAIDVRSDLTLDLPVKIEFRPCREDVSFNNTQVDIVPVCERMFYPLNANVDRNCWNSITGNKVVEFRYHMEPDLNNKDISCPPDTSYRRGNTCYKKTDKLEWDQARRQCWVWGGDLSFPLKEGNECSAPIIIRDAEELWIAGSSKMDVRPILQLDSPLFQEGTYDLSNDLCYPNIKIDLWCLLIGKCSGIRRGLCALPPTSLNYKPPIPEPSIKCPIIKPGMLPEWPYSDYEWLIEGYPGYSVIQACPVGQNGKVYWKCGKNGDWEGYPDFSECYNIDFDGALDSLDSEDSDVVPFEILNEVYQQVYHLDNFATGDIGHLITVMDKAMEKQKQHLSNGVPQDEYNYSERYTVESVRLIDTILEKSKSWFGLPPKKTMINLNRVQNNVEAFVQTFLKYSNTSESSFDYENIALNIKKNITKKTLYTFKAFGNSQIVIESSNSSNLNVIFQAFPNMHCIFNKQFNCVDPEPVGENLLSGTVIGASLLNQNNDLDTSSNVRVSLLFNNEIYGNNRNKLNPQCVYWSKKTLRWKTNGCRLVKFTDKFTQCECDHLTNFAVLMDFNNILEDNEDLNNILEYITLIGCSLSIVSLLVCLFVFFVILRNTGERVFIHQNLCISLLFGEIILLAGIDSADEEKLLCIVISACLHFFFLSSFFWMLLEGINIYLKLVKVFDSGIPRRSVYYMTGYGFPLIIVLLSAFGIEYFSQGGYTADSFCWLNSKNGAIWLFNGPALVIILVNGFFYTMALRIARRSILRRQDVSMIRNTMLYFRGSTSLLCVLGITWIFGFAYFSEGFAWVAYIFVVLNSLQGVFILIFHVLLNEKARQDTRRFFKKNYYIQKWWLDQSTTYSGRDKDKNTGVKDLSTQEISSLSNKSSKF
ncbi:adhesion G protein-coupled receptor L3 isoform X2 [Lepeophtheirus salmonis]|nr:adhesion G protein-coupled receptor L3-like isoform X2 [Lepeophtheirus salmonis]